MAAYNEGFWGVKVTPSTTYTGQLFAKTSNFTGR